MERTSFIYRILARLAYLQTTRTAGFDHESAAGLFEWLKWRAKGSPSAWVPATELQLVEALQDLEKLGIVQSSYDSSIASHDEKYPPHWRLAGGLPADREAVMRDGGDGDGDGDRDQPPNQGRDPGGGGDGGGDGLSQLLEHPILFSVDELEFNGALNNALGFDPEER
jgi:hypothetical protein